MRKIKNLFGLVCLLFVGLTVGYASPVREKVVSTYTSKLGTKELTGKNDGAFVNECLSVAGLDNEAYFRKTGKGFEWCAAFVTWTFNTAEVRALKNAWAPSWFPTDKTIFQQGKGQLPRQADVFGLWYANKKRIGHVGFIDEWPPSSDYCITVEGNWGGAVARVRRLKKNIYKVSRWV